MDQAQQEAPLRQQLLQAQVTQAGTSNQLNEQQLQDLRELHDTRSIVFGALGVKPFLDSNNTQGAVEYLTARRNQIKARGGDTSDTDQVIAQLTAGDTAGALQNIDQALTMGQQLGLLKPGAQQPDNVQSLIAAGYKPNTPEFRDALFKLEGRDNAITPYQQAQLGIDEQKLALEREKLARGEGGKPPAGYRYTPDGNLEFIPGGPADKNAQPKHNLPTEGQAKANAFTKEIEAGLKDMDKALADMDPEAAKAGNPRKAPGATGQIAASLPLIGGDTARNIVSSQAEQRYYNGLKRVVTAKLRADSGATITQSEIDQQFDQYMPKFWDSDEVIKQKRDGLNVLLESVRSRGSTPAPNDEPAPEWGIKKL